MSKNCTGAIRYIHGSGIAFLNDQLLGEDGVIDSMYRVVVSIQSISTAHLSWSWTSH